MNYRHAFHAGNFADVFKHVVLALALKRLTQKEKPLRVIDTHAGVGTYRLDGPEAQRTGEWVNGIGRLVGPHAVPIASEMEALLAPYLDVVRSFNPVGGLIVYPGSPAIALSLMRPTDSLIATERHPEDLSLLRRNLRHDRRAKVLELDGWQAVRSLLPPKERRGLILIDPPFEEPGEFDRLIGAIADGTRRFATGTYLLWLPVKDRRLIESFQVELRPLTLGKAIWAELRIAPSTPDGPLTSTALVLVNPPYGLLDDLSGILPFLVDRLSTADGGGSALREL